MTSIELDENQLEAIGKMKNGCILCGGVGSGKSRTAIAYYYKEMGGSLKGSPMRHPKNLYIITTARKRDTLEWEDELLPFGLSSQQPTRYPQVVVDSWNNISKYALITDSFFIFDEQRVVGWGKWTRSFLRIAKFNRWILLSATPGDTWSDYIPVFVANGYFKNKTHFITEHVVYKRFATYPIVDRYLNEGYLMRLKNSILVDIKYEKKAEQHHIDIVCEYDRESYKMAMKDQWNYEKDIPVNSASEMCYLLRKIVNMDESRKNKIIDIFKDHKRLIIFYSFDYELDILKSIPFGPGVTVAEWNGHVHNPTPDTPRWVYFVNYSAGAEGWNCITTDTMIFYSQQYSYKRLIQACGRIDRRNTPFDDLYYYHLWSHASIDMTIRRALKNKKNFNERDFVRL